MNDNDISTAVSDYLKANDTAENARRSVTLAAGNDPDYEAELRRVSAKTGVPLDSVRAFPAEVKQQANLAAFDFGEMAQKFPATATFLGNLDNAKIAHDDVGSLTSWEGVVADKLIGLSQGLKVTGNFLADSMQRTFKGAAYNLPAGFWGAAAAPLEVGSQGLQSLGLPEWAANSELGQGFRWLSSLAQRSGNAMALPKPQGNIEAGLASGFESLGTNLPLLPLGIATQSYKLPTALMSAVTGGTSYMEATGKGASPAKAATLAVPDAAAEYVTEQYGMKQLFAIPGVQQGVGALLKGIANFAVKEGVGEQAATIWQDFNKWMVLNPDKSVNEFIAERPDAAIQTAIATVVGGGGQVALVAGVNSLVGNVKSAGQAGQLAETLGQLNKIAEAAKVVERDADTAQGFFQSVLEQSGGATEVWISPAALAQSGLGQRLAQVIPDVAQQIDAAVATGSDVRLPIADLMARMVGPELEALAPLVATEPGGFSQVAAQEYLQSGAVQEFQAEVEKALAERQDNDTFKASADAVRGSIKTQLDTAARFTPQVNDAYAGMVGSWYSTLAARLNMTPEQVFEMYPLRIGAESVAGAQFEQGGQLQIDTPEFRNWFGESKVVDAAGKPLVVYHGSPDTRFMDSDATFKSQKERFGFGLPEGAHWFASSEVAAKTYADPRRAFDYQNAKEGVIPAYLSMLNPMVIDAAGQNWRDAQRRGKTSDVIAEARSKGHDGVVIRNVKDNYNNGAKTKAVDTYVVFDSKQIKSAVGNRGTFDPNDPNILHQQARGAFNPSTLTVTLLKGADLSTFLHESGHFFLEVYADLAALPNAPAGIQQDMQGLLDWFGVKSLAEWRSLDFEEKRSYHEQFARGFEAYLFEGKAPSIEVQGLFQRFRAWLLAVYKDLKALKVELTDEVRGVMDRMLATEEQIKLAEYGRSMLPLFETAEQAGMTPEEFAAYQSLGEEATANAIEQLQARGLRDMRWLHKARGRIIKALQKEAQATRREVEMDVRGEVMSQPIYRAWTFLTAKLGDDDQVPANKPRSITPGSVDETIDPLFVAIAKLGGINRDQLISEWGMDAAEKARAPAAFGGKTMVDRKDGRSIDEMGMALAERGYLSVDDNGRYDQREFEEKFFDGLGGHDHYSSNFDYDQTVERKAGGQLANPAALGAGRLDRASLDSMGLPPEIIQLLDARKMLRKDALHPDIVASMFGFTSGDELVRKLAAADRPNVEIAGRTDARMLQEHGELADTAAIEKAADEAIHNDARARFVTTEANALAKATGKRGVLAPAAKAAANAMIARLKLRNIRPNQYASAEVRAAKASAAASKAGDLTQAAAEKRNQLINTYATRAAYDALADVEAGLRYLKKFSTADSKTLDPDYAEQIHNLLERFDLRAMSQKAIDKRLALADWITAQQDMGLEPTIPDDLVNEAFRKPYKELTVEEFRGLVDTVKQIEHLGRLKHKLLTAANNRAYEAVRDEIVASINLHSQGREANTRTPTTNLGRAVQGLKRFWASHIKAATWARVMDGGKDGGPMWEYFVRAANERGDMETAMRAEATLKLAQILDPVFKLGKMGGSGIWFPHIQRSLNREARLAIALNVGNEGNLQRLLGGENWTEQQLAPVLATITLAEWQAVQAVWDHFETYRPMIGEKEKRVHGKEPAWVDAGSRITAQLGLRGGYYPIKYDPAASQRAEEHADAESAKRQLQGAYTSATTRRSFTKARAEEVNGRPLLYTLAGLYSGVNDVIHDLAWHEWLIDTNRLLRSKSIDSAIREHYGPEVKQQFKTWSQDIAEGEKGADHAVDIALSRLRQGISAAGLGFNAMSAFIQPLGITQSITRVGAGWIGRGVVKYLAHPIDLTRDVLGRSTFMENRGRTRFRELNELRNQVQDQGVFNEVVGRYAYWLMMRFQQMVDVPTWWGAYEKAIAEGNEEKRAIGLADQAVIDSQGGGQTKDLSAIERGGPAQRLFTVFYSFMNTALNAGVSQTMSADTPAKRARLAVDYAMLYVVPAVLGYLLKAALTPGDDEDDPEKLARKLLASQIDYLMGLMVVVREFAEVGKTLAGANDFGRDYTGPAGLRMISDTVSLAKQAAQGEFDDAFRKAAINVIGDFSGLPAAQVNRTITGSQALAEGKTENPGAIVFGFSQKR